MRIGVLALQGDVREHQAALLASGADDAPAVRRPSELAGVDALVIPGGESTTIDKLLRAFGLFEPLRERLAAGMPAFGSCAGMILLATDVVGAIEGQRSLGAIDMRVRRNAFGRQVDSFEAELVAPAFAVYAGRSERGPRVEAGEAPASADAVSRESIHAVFIRAPWVESIGPEVEVLARMPEASGNGRIVAVRQRAVLATAFHPEVTTDFAVHRYFVRLVREHLGA